jgi:outer membrane protein assembly factor BamB
MGNIYLSVANAAPFPGTEEFPNTTSRPGENPYTNHLVSLNEETGELNWAYSITGHDMFDLDHHLAPVSAMVPINGEERHVILSTGKHAIVVCADAATGEELWRNPIGMHQNDESDDVGEIAEGEEIEVYPGSQGGNQMPFAYKDGVMYIPNITAPSYFTSSSYTSAIPIVGTEGTGTMFALDASTGDILWETDTPSPLYGGAVVMNDVVFSAALDGIVRGFNTETGEVIFTFQTSAGVVAPLTASGDYLFVPAGTVLSPRDDSVEPLPEFQAALFALAIGGDQELPVASPEAGATPETEAGASPVASTDAGVVVSGVDIAFEPKSFAIAADTDVTITFQNNGMLQHDFVIEGTDFATDLLNGGDAQELVVNLPAGEYVYYCSVAGHREAGMEGTLTVG